MIFLSNLIFCQEEYFVNLTARARELRPESDCRILHYFATDGQGFQCYQAQEDLLAQPHLILRDSNGDTVLHGNAKVPFYDFRLAEARELYVNGRSDQSKPQNNIQLNF